MEGKGSFEDFKNPKETPASKINALLSSLEKDQKQLWGELKTLEHDEKEAKGDAKKGLEIRESYLRADHAGTLKAQEILLRAKRKINSFGLPENVMLMSVENGFHGSDSTLSEVRFTKEGIENLDTWFKQIKRLSEENPKDYINDPLMTHKAVSFLYEDRRRNPIPFGDGLLKDLSKMKPGKEVRWATDADNVVIVVEREKVQKERSTGGGYTYPTEVVRIRAEIEGAR